LFISHGFVHPYFKKFKEFEKPKGENGGGNESKSLERPSKRSIGGKIANNLLNNRGNCRWKAGFSAGSPPFSRNAPKAGEIGKPIFG